MKRTGLPYSEGCFVCGTQNPMGLKLKFHRDKNKIITEFISNENHQGYKGLVHGGILSTLLDEAMGWAPTLLTRRMTVSAEITIRFVKPVPLGKKVIVTTQAKKLNRRLFTSTGEISDEEGTIYVMGFGKFIPLSEKKTKEVDAWLLYDDKTLRIFDEKNPLA